MKYSSLLVFSKDTQKQGIKDEESYAAGTEITLPVYSDDADSLEFSELESNLDAADSAVAGDSVNDTLLRMELVYAAALFRDAQYGVSARKYMKGLALHGATRALYETGRSHLELKGS